MRRLVVTLLACLLATVLLGAPAVASVVIKMDIEDLTRTATVVALGTVEETHSFWTDDHRRILTEVTLRVEVGLESSQEGDVLHFFVLGGAVGDLAQYVPGEASFVPSERVIVFLEPRGDSGRLGVVGMSQGKILVLRDDARGDVAVSDMGSLHVATLPPSVGDDIPGVVVSGLEVESAGVKTWPLPLLLDRIGAAVPIVSSP